MFAAARLGGSEKFVTGIFWAVIVLAWVGFGVGLSAGNGLQALIMILVAVVFLGLALQLRRTQPVAYRIEPSGLVIERRAGETLVRGSVEAHAEKVSLGLRLGSGGLYGYRGRFKMSTGGWARAIVTDMRRVVLIRVGGRPLVLSPVDPAAFVAEVRDA